MPKSKSREKRVISAMKSNITYKELGLKIKSLRKMKKITQAELVGDKITRNMLSRIESGNANPSLETLKLIAEGLSVSVAYLLSDDDDLLYYEKKDKLNKIYRAYEAKKYKAVIDLMSSLPGLDNELYLILSSSHLEYAKELISNGSLVTAEKNLNSASEYAEKTLLNTEYIKAQIPMYSAICKNIQSPLLEFDSQVYIGLVSGSVEYEFFKYLTHDYSYAFENPMYALHMEAKKLINERNYLLAVKRLLTASELIKQKSYNAYVVFSIYADLEYCYKQLYDYENAYLYSTKRMTLLENFKN